MAALVNMSNLLNGKDSRWLQLEVCREFQRNKCSRPDTECKFAHPPANVEVQNGRVTACYDSIKGRCNREKPPCKYFHPPQHLKDQLLINGRNHLALKNALMQQMGMAPPTPPAAAIIPSPLQPMTANRFMPASNPYNPYYTIIGPEHAATALASTTPIPQSMSLAAATTTMSIHNAAQPQKRTDRVQNNATPTPTPSTSTTTSNGSSITNSSVPLISPASILANFVESGKKRNAECLQIFPGLLPYKRPAPDKQPGGMVYHQPTAAAYQQLIQLQSAQQSYVPVSFNYGSSDSENEITDEEEEVVAVSNKQNGQNKDEEENLTKSMSTIKLPEPAKSTNQIIEEDDDEFLHKKEVPEARPPPALKPKEKVKIMIPKLSDFKDDDDDEFSSKKVPTASNKKTGLLGMLPKPSNSIGPSPKPQVPVTPVSQQPTTSIHTKPLQQQQHPAPSTSTSTSNESQPKKIGLIPYALMDHKKAADSKKVSKKKGNESDSDEEESSTGFFTFSSNDDLPQVNEEEIKSLINKEAQRLEQRKRQHEGAQDLESEQQQNYAQYYQQQQQPDIDKAAISALVGGNKAKRSKLEDIQIVDLSANEVLPDREEWIRRTLAGETGYIPTGQIDEKGPNALAKRKHQLSYLAVRAEKNMAELEAMWSANRQTAREGKSKYGF